MRLHFIFACILSAAIGSAHAQQSRERLEGFGGLRFGTKLDEAKRVLGAGFKERATKLASGKTGTELAGEMTYANEVQIVIYHFGSDQTLDNINIGPIDMFKNKNMTACLSGGRIMQALQRQYGSPVVVKNEKDLREYNFTFKDGNEISLHAIFSHVCITSTSFRTPQSKKNY